MINQINLEWPTGRILQDFIRILEEKLQQTMGHDRLQLQNQIKREFANKIRSKEVESDAMYHYVPGLSKSIS